MPLESALYFAASECLTNATKHADAARVDVALRQSGTHTRITIIDDGHGGARLRPGGGLDGVRRRLSPFDGQLLLDSPEGGPTRIEIVVPHPAG
jgi:signal transduction histidine kinase